MCVRARVYSIHIYEACSVHIYEACILYMYMRCILLFIYMRYIHEPARDPFVPMGHHLGNKQ